MHRQQKPLNDDCGALALRQQSPELKSPWNDARQFRNGAYHEQFNHVFCPIPHNDFPINKVKDLCQNYASQQRGPSISDIRAVPLSGVCSISVSSHGRPPDYTVWVEYPSIRAYYPSEWPDAIQHYRRNQTGRRSEPFSQLW